MKNLSIIPAVVLVIVFCALIPVSAENNLVTNPSFETGGGDLPAGWQTTKFYQESGASDIKYEKGGAHSGDRLVTIINHKQNDVRFSQSINIKENTQYRLSCWVRTENVGDGGLGANISVDGRMETSKDIKGTNGMWEYVEMYARTGGGVGNMVITVGLGGYGSMNTGKASFDDVAVEEVGSIPEGASVAYLGDSDSKAGENSSGKTPPINFGSIGGPGDLFWALAVVAGVVVIVGALFYVWLLRRIAPKTN